MIIIVIYAELIVTLQTIVNIILNKKKIINQTIMTIKIIKLLLIKIKIKNFSKRYNKNNYHITNIIDNNKINNC